MSRGALLISLIAASNVAYAANDGGGDQPHSDAESTAIVGGSEAQPGQWPDAVAVLGTKGTCTGTLIAPNVVLTAGHCADINPVQVVANTIDYAKDDGIRAHVATTTPYPNWQGSYDAAVLVLASSITTVTPRKLASSCTFKGFTKDTAVRLVGFGATDMMGQVTNTQLKQAMAPVIDPDCMGGYGCKKVLAPGGEFVAGGTGDADSCYGDSGGPVYMDTPNGTLLVGTVSRGVDNSDTPCGSGGIYVRTDKLIEWIEETTATTLDIDECTGEAYAGENVPAEESDEVGCSATRGGGSGLVAFGALAWIIRRRRR